MQDFIVGSASILTKQKLLLLLYYTYFYIVITFENFKILV